MYKLALSFALAAALGCGDRADTSPDGAGPDGGPAPVDGRADPGDGPGGDAGATPDAGPGDPDGGPGDPDASPGGGPGDPCEVLGPPSCAPGLTCRWNIGFPGDPGFCGPVGDGAHSEPCDGHADCGSGMNCAAIIFNPPACTLLCDGANNGSTDPRCSSGQTCWVYAGTGDGKVGVCEDD